MKLLKEISQKYEKEVYDNPQSGFWTIDNRYALFKDTGLLYDARYGIELAPNHEEERWVPHYIYKIKDELLKK